MDEIRSELERIIVEINNNEAHLKRETYPINNIKEHLNDIRNKINNLNDRIKDNPAHEEVSKKLSEYSEKITLVLSSGEVFKTREKAVVVLKWISDGMLLVKSEKSEDREISFILKTWETYQKLLSFVKFKFFGKDEFLEKEFLEYVEINKKLFFDSPKSDDAKVYYSYCLITVARKLSIVKDDISELKEIVDVLKDMNTDIILRVKKVLEINNKNYDDKLKVIDMNPKQLKVVLSGFKINKSFSKGLIGFILAKNIISYEK